MWILGLLTRIYRRFPVNLSCCWFYSEESTLESPKSIKKNGGNPWKSRWQCARKNLKYVHTAEITLSSLLVEPTHFGSLAEWRLWEGNDVARLLVVLPSFGKWMALIHSKPHTNLSVQLKWWKGNILARENTKTWRTSILNVWRGRLWTLKMIVQPC